MQLQKFQITVHLKLAMFYSSALFKKFDTSIWTNSALYDDDKNSQP